MAFQDNFRELFLRFPAFFRTDCCCESGEKLNVISSWERRHFERISTVFFRFNSTRQVAVNAKKVYCAGFVEDHNDNFTRF